MISFLNITLPILYFLLVGIYGKAFFSDRVWAKKIKTYSLVVVLCVHIFYIAVKTITFHYVPFATIFEVFSFLSFAVAATYFIIELRSKQKETGYFILNIAFWFQLTSSLFIQTTTEIPPLLQSTLFVLHVSSALIGYAAMTIGGAYGFLYLMLYSEMKAIHFGVVYRKLPSLETLHRMAYSSLKIVVLFLGSAILFGTIWLWQVYGYTYLADPKFIGTVFLWLLYGSLLYCSRRSLLSGRTVMFLVVIAFFVALVLMLLINFVLTEFHAFH